MARKRKQVPTDRIVTLGAGGRTAEQITATLQAEGYDVSRATVTRRLRESKGLVNAVRVAAPRSEVPLADEIPDEVPDGTPVGDVDKWIAMGDEAADKAFGLGDYSTFTTILGKLATLKEHQRKASPPAKSDPNDDPDLRKIGALVAPRLLKLARDAAS